mgnify:CR=1 FL=1
MPEIIENCSQVDAQNALKSNLGGTLGLNLSSFGTGSRRMETGIWKMDVGIQKMSTGMWKMETEIRYPVVDPPVSGETARGNRSRARTRQAVARNPGRDVVQIY